MNINYFKLRDHVRIRFPKPASNTPNHSRFGGLGSAFQSIQFTDRQAETMVSALLSSAERNNRGGYRSNRGNAHRRERRYNPQLFLQKTGRAYAAAARPVSDLLPTPPPAFLIRSVMTLRFRL
ncbi:hypothetical protein GGU11DRAFT_748371 [Lentinula aff. detonsa]|nr:hypothetical protein GGU11DRAFT_748371 [Lentinula aff. detonsa]